MGLDTIELIVAIEDKFEITIPNADAPKLAVLGDMHKYIVQALRRRDQTPDEAQVWESLKLIVVDLLAVRPDEVTRSAHIIHDLRAR